MLAGYHLQFESAENWGTTSWLPGEVITDVHPFAASPRLAIGLYDPKTGEQLGEPFQINTQGRVEVLPVKFVERGEILLLTR